MRRFTTRRAVAALMAISALVVPLAMTPAASASEGGQPVYAEGCPDGYKGVIVGTSGGTEVYACTNLLP